MSALSEMSEDSGLENALSPTKDSLYFIALLPPPPLQERIRVLQQEMSQRFHSHAALKSPPHITLIPPLSLSESGAGLLQKELNLFSPSSTPSNQNSYTPEEPPTIVLEGFAAFAPRVLYIHVQPHRGLTTLRTHLRDRLQRHPALQLPANPRHSYPFVPHITLGFRDLSPENFERAWAEFQQRSFQANFVADGFTLLQHNGQHWEPIVSYPWSS